MTELNIKIEYLDPEILGIVNHLLTRIYARQQKFGFVPKYETIPLSGFKSTTLSENNFNKPQDNASISKTKDPIYDEIAKKNSEGEIIVDSDNVPWDERVHSHTKQITAQGRWRKKRGIDQMYLDSVENTIRINDKKPEISLSIPKDELIIVPPSPSSLLIDEKNSNNTEIKTSEDESIATKEHLVSQQNSETVEPKITKYKDLIPTFDELMIMLASKRESEDITDIDIKRGCIKVDIAELIQLREKPEKIPDFYRCVFVNKGEKHVA